jgi:hypothetical protein
MNMSSVGEEFPKEQERVRQLLAQYMAIGPAGFFGRTMINAVLQRAEKAAISGDLIAILRSYKELKDCE